MNEVNAAYARMGQAKARFGISLLDLHKIAFSGHPDARERVDETLTTLRARLVECIDAKENLLAARKGAKA